MKHHLFKTVLSSLAMTAVAHGGTWVEQSLDPVVDADLSSGIDQSKTYTHLVDWATDEAGSDAPDKGGPGATVNGVVFIEGGLTGTNYTLTGAAQIIQDQSTDNNTYPASSGMFDINDDFYFDGSSLLTDPFETLTLTGLTGGATYTISHYVSKNWNGSPQVLNGDDDGNENLLNTDRGSANGPRVIRYTYTQAPDDTDFVMTFDGNVNSGSFHHYAFTNELMQVPEPSSFGVLAFGAAGLLGRRLPRRSGRKP